MKAALTEKQKRVLDFIRQAIVYGRRAPTIREIAGRFGFSSTGTVRDYLRCLSRKGFVTLHPNKARAIELAPQLAAIPVMGRVPAGSPQLAQEDIEGYIDVPSVAGRREDTFALRVRGDSMKDAGIMDGDAVVVRRQPQAQSGDIVVALIGDEATVKRLRRTRRGYCLEPANKKYRPLACGESTAIIGKVISVVRTYV